MLVFNSHLHQSDQGSPIQDRQSPHLSQGLPKLKIHNHIQPQQQKTGGCSCSQTGSHSRGTMTISTLEPAHSSAVLLVDANRAPEECNQHATSSTTINNHTHQNYQASNQVSAYLFAERASQRTAIPTAGGNLLRSTHEQRACCRPALQLAQGC